MRHVSNHEQYGMLELIESKDFKYLNRTCIRAGSYDLHQVKSEISFHRLTWNRVYFYCVSKTPYHEKYLCDITANKVSAVLFQVQTSKKKNQ